jgi:predicted phage terminase large subunit-like protein
MLPDLHQQAVRTLLAEKERRQNKEEMGRQLEEEKVKLEGSLIDFFVAAWPEIDPAPLEVNWHHEAIAEHLEAVAYGQIRKLLINVPPRFTKTILSSIVFPAWIWAQQPDADYPLLGPQAKFLCLSYSDQLSMDSATTARRLISSFWYRHRWGSRVQITADQDAKNKFDTLVGGTRISASFGGTVTGRGGDIRIIDDPHKIEDAESDVVREGVLRTYDGTLKSRITDPHTTAEIVIMQRVHENDLSGHILDTDEDFVHLCLPAEFESDRRCVTVLGWEDPRKADGELLWPDRFGLPELVPFKRNPYEWAGQWQQRPAPRGGAIFKRDWWQLWEPPDGKFPPCDYILASLDSAYTSKEENDPSGFTVWGVFSPKHLTQTPTGGMVESAGSPRVILMEAWRKHLPIHGVHVDYLPDEEADILEAADESIVKAAQKRYEKRAKPLWGLVEWVAYSCRRFKVDRLIIEAKASGLDVSHEMRRLYADEAWTVDERQVQGDKVSRAHAQVPIFTRGLVYAPDRDWAELVITEMETFPKGRFKDLTDSATQALKYLRENNILEHPEERQREELRRMRFQRKVPRLYPM